MELARTDNRNIYKLLLADKRSENTRRAYRADLMTFFGCEPTEEVVKSFLGLSAANMAYQLAAYKCRMFAAGLSESTVNRRLSAVRSLISCARRLGCCSVDPHGLVAGEKVKAYRDTSGPPIEDIQRMLTLPDRTTLKGKRDVVILTLLWEYALRRAEVCKLNLSDYDREGARLFIQGKGRGTQREPIDLSEHAVLLIDDYLGASGMADGDGDSPLFINYDRRKLGSRLTSDGLYWLVGWYADRAGIKRKVSPHRIRHGSITAALDATNGDVRAVQRLSRHANLATLQIYDDNHKHLQGRVSRLLSGLARC